MTEARRQERVMSLGTTDGKVLVYNLHIADSKDDGNFAK